MGFIKGVSLMALMRCWCVVSGAPVCASGDFDSQVKNLLNHEMLSPEDVRNITQTFDEFQNTLRTRWNGADLFVYGSLPTGLAAKTSDVDFYLQIPEHNDTADVYIVHETAKLLSEKPQKYSDITPKIDVRVPMMTFYDNSLQRYVDLSFRSASGVENTQLLAYYLNLDDRHVPLAAIIKFWCKIHHLTGKGLLPNYSLYLIIAFYLQQKSMAPPGYKLQARLPPRDVNKWNANFETLPYRVENNETLYELLGGFFKFYSNFNFSEDCVSPFAGRPVARKFFEDISDVPEEFSWYLEKMNTGRYTPLRIGTELCVQDIFEHNANVAHRVHKDAALKFKDHLKISAQKYDEVPRDMFLCSILTKYNHKESPTDKGYEVS